MNSTHLPYGKQWIDEEDVKAVVEVLTSDWLTTGPKVQEFETELAQVTGAKYAVVVNSGTAALHAAYFAAGVCPGDEVITSPLTFAATANAALYQGAKPVFVDIDYNSGNIDPDKIEKAITGKTRVIAPVAFTGRPARMDEITAIARKHNLTVVEDGAHALGAAYKGRKTGTIADMTIFSFHPVKHITTGEGGAVVTDDAEYYKKLILFRSHGITRDEQQMADNHGPWYNEMQDLGYNYRLSDIQCALGLSQLKKLNMFLERRSWIAAEYGKRLAHLKDYIELPGLDDFTSPAWHLYVIKVKGGREERKNLVEFLHSRQIGVQVHYLPVYLHPYYRQLGFEKGLCPEAEKFYEGAVSLPIFPKMDNDDIVRVCDELNDYFLSGKR